MPYFLTIAHFHDAICNDSDRDNLAVTAQKVSVFGVVLVRMRENMDQNNSEYGHFSCTEYFLNFLIFS